jgi:hypothetical protein
MQVPGARCQVLGCLQGMQRKMPMVDGWVGYLGFQLFLNLNLKLGFFLDMAIQLVWFDFA